MSFSVGMNAMRRSAVRAVVSSTATFPVSYILVFPEIWWCPARSSLVRFPRAFTTYVPSVAYSCRTRGVLLSETISPSSVVTPSGNVTSCVVPSPKSNVTVPLPPIAYAENEYLPSATETVTRAANGMPSHSGPPSSGSVMLYAAAESIR